jgi:hypothetical protein
MKYGPIPIPDNEVQLTEVDSRKKRLTSINLDESFSTSGCACMKLLTTATQSGQVIEIMSGSGYLTATFRTMYCLGTFEIHHPASTILKDMSM